jgi:hypothetical protein
MIVNVSVEEKIFGRDSQGAWRRDKTTLTLTLTLGDSLEKADWVLLEWSELVRELLGFSSCELLLWKAGIPEAGDSSGTQSKGNVRRWKPLPSKGVSRDSSVGIATVYGLDDQGGGSSSPCRVKNIHFSISSRPAVGSTQPPIKWVPGVKRQGREADHSPPTSAEVKKMWIYRSTSLYVFMA